MEFSLEIQKDNSICESSHLFKYTDLNEAFKRAISL